MSPFFLVSKVHFAESQQWLITVAKKHIRLLCVCLCVCVCGVGSHFTKQSVCFYSHVCYQISPNLFIEANLKIIFEAEMNICLEYTWFIAVKFVVELCSLKLLSVRCV